MAINRWVLSLVFLASVGVGSIAGAADIVVNEGDSLQSALNAARPGDTILLQPGVTFVGDFVLPVKSGATFITVRSAAPPASLPAPGQRTNPAYAPFLPKLKARSGPVLLTADRSHHWRFENIEFLPNVNQTTAIVVLGATDNHQSSVDLLPHDIVFDRIYMHDDEGEASGVSSSTAVPARSSIRIFPASDASGRRRRQLLDGMVQDHFF